MPRRTRPLWWALVLVFLFWPAVVAQAPTQGWPPWTPFVVTAEVDILDGSTHYRLTLAGNVLWTLPKGCCGYVENNILRFPVHPGLPEGTYATIVTALDEYSGASAESMLMVTVGEATIPPPTVPMGVGVR